MFCFVLESRFRMGRTPTEHRHGSVFLVAHGLANPRWHVGPEVRRQVHIRFQQRRGRSTHVRHTVHGEKQLRSATRVASGPGTRGRYGLAGDALDDGQMDTAARA